MSLFDAPGGTMKHRPQGLQRPLCRLACSTRKLIILASA